MTDTIFQINFPMMETGFLYDRKDLLFNEVPDNGDIFGVHFLGIVVD